MLYSFFCFMEQFLKKPLWFEFHDYEKIFILGLGGGCDIISARAVRFLFDFSEHSKINYGNSKRKLEDDLERITANIHRVPPNPKPNVCDEHYIDIDPTGTTNIDRSIPWEPDGRPFIVRCNKNSIKELPREIESLDFDLIIGVDTGGDAMIEGAKSGSRGRDKEMVDILKQSEVPFLLFIVGPGCDGESQERQILKAFHDQDEAGKYLGSCSIEPLMPSFETLASNLGENRTPNILKRVFRGELAPNERGKIVIPREIRPAISKIWLTHCFAFGLY